MALGVLICFSGVRATLRDSINLLVYDRTDYEQKLHKIGKSDVLRDLQEGKREAFSEKNGLDYFTLGRLLPIQRVVSVNGERVCRDSGNTNLYLKIDGKPEYYTRPDAATAWQKVEAGDFNFKLACGSGS